MATPTVGDYSDKVAAHHISVAPNDVYRYGTDVKQLGDDISQQFQNIQAKWADLSLGWSGTSATDAQNFSDMYHNAVTDFFGETDPNDSTKVLKDGVLSHFASGLIGAANIYAQAEVKLYFAFKWFGDLLENPNFDPNTDTIPDNADVQPPPKDLNPPGPGERKSDDPPVTEDTNGAEQPWFQVGQPVKGDWSWTVDIDGPKSWEIDVKDGAIWTGHPGPGVTETLVDDSN